MIIAKVLLTKTIESLGSVGEVVDVADGYARNYLFPKRLAAAPTEHNIARYAKERAAHAAAIEEREEKARRLRDVLANRTLVFVRKAHDDDRLYGSVRAEDIVSQIEEEIGEHIEVSRLQMEHSIETLGPHAVTIGLYKEIAVEVRVRVDGEASPKETRLKETSLDETDLKETPLPEEHLKETSLKEE
ncbi:50S ribosomal protein L9 [Candidatus Bipolaricaulota bacterium]|jgi:large subunit ribosomal protein L9|nr:50S ribosomal protein L9 [Candidatus Bipolaricaulota bacterium]